MKTLVHLLFNSFSFEHGMTLSSNSDQFVFKLWDDGFIPLRIIIDILFMLIKRMKFSIIDYFVNELISSCQRPALTDRHRQPGRHRQLAADASETKPGIIVSRQRQPSAAQSAEATQNCEKIWYRKPHLNILLPETKENPS